MFALTVPGMTDEDVAEVIKDAAKERLRELGRWGNLTTIADLSGVSDNTWRSLVNDGRPPKREGTKVEMLRFLRWPLDAFETIEAICHRKGITTRRRAVDAALDELGRRAVDLPEPPSQGPPSGDLADLTAVASDLRRTAEQLNQALGLALRLAEQQSGGRQVGRDP
jgi:hypothetical protein